MWVGVEISWSVCAAYSEHRNDRGGRLWCLGMGDGGGDTRNEFGLTNCWVLISPSCLTRRPAPSSPRDAESSNILLSCSLSVCLSSSSVATIKLFLHNASFAGGRGWTHQRVAEPEFTGCPCWVGLCTAPGAYAHCERSSVKSSST